MNFGLLILVWVSFTSGVIRILGLPAGFGFSWVFHFGFYLLVFHCGFLGFFVLSWGWVLTVVLITCLCFV